MQIFRYQPARARILQHCAIRTVHSGDNSACSYNSWIVVDSKRDRLLRAFLLQNQGRAAVLIDCSLLPASPRACDSEVSNQSCTDNVSHVRGTARRDLEDVCGSMNENKERRKERSCRSRESEESATGLPAILNLTRKLQDIRWSEIGN